MAKLKLSKSALQQERNQLKLYQRTLPSLDLKRRQLTVELAKAKRALAAAEQAVVELGRLLHHGGNIVAVKLWAPKGNRHALSRRTRVALVSDVKGSAQGGTIVTGGRLHEHVAE